MFFVYTGVPGALYGSKFVFFQAKLHGAYRYVNLDCGWSTVSTRVPARTLANPIALLSTRVPARTLANPIARRPNISESHSETLEH